MTEAARSLASEEGLRRFRLILEAIDLWREELTPVQRRVIRAGGGKAAKVTTAKLATLGLIEPPVEGVVNLTEWGEFVRVSNGGDS